MITEGLTHKFVFTVVVLGIVLVIAAFKVMGQLAVKGARALRNRPKSARSLTSTEDTPGDAPQESGGGFGRRRAALAKADAAPDEAAGEPDFTHPVLGEMTSNEVLRAIAEANMPPPLHDGPLPEAIEAARKRAIVFRQSLPLGPGMDGLSFFGGLPIGPVDFQWPRRHGSAGVPLTFIMQWDCAQFAAQDTTGLLPGNGVLYCFIDLAWGAIGDGGQTHAFLHHPGPTVGWSEAPLPADAPPIFGNTGARYVTGCTDKVDNANEYVPRLMPRFPFTPIGFDLPLPMGLSGGEDTEESKRLFWDEIPSVSETLLEIQRGEAEGRAIPDQPDLFKPFARPFPAYPHDFAAVRHLAATMIKELDWINSYVVQSAFPDMTDEERSAAVAIWVGEAKELYQLGCQRPMAAPLDQAIADDIWQWLETRQAIFRSGFDSRAVEAVSLSLGLGSRALDRVPQAFIDEAMGYHTLASEEIAYEPYDRIKHGSREEYVALRQAGGLSGTRRLHAPTPARVFGPPSYVQGDVEELMDEYVLLLELPSHGAPGLGIGDGVLQYLIRPDDLAAGRFDRVESVISSY